MKHYFRGVRQRKSMGVRFSEYKPSGDLSGYIQSYYTGEFNLHAEENFIQTVVPNGCIELIIHLTREHCELIKVDAWGRSPDFTLIGLNTRPYEVRFQKPVLIFGIRFNPEGIYKIFGVPPALFTDTFENSTDVLGVEFDTYCEHLRATTNTLRQVQLTEEYLKNKASKIVEGYDYVRHASETIRKHHGLISLQELIEAVPISPRQLQREFKNRLGITAKEYMRLSRLNAIQKYMQRSTDLNLTDLSYENGFADQSHFIKEYRRFTGTNPRSYLRERERFITLPADLD